jgi:hypothetical protein
MWTPTALASENRAYASGVWRVVEAQHRISTNRLADRLDDQSRLENLADAVKPDLPLSAQGLHYLLASPFRYGHSVASRFRAADVRPGIFYASEVEATAVIETIYWRLRFYLRSIDFVPSTTVSEHLSFRAEVKATRCLDLTAPPFDADTALWTDLISYVACQELAAAARDVETQVIRSTSARDPQARANLAILDPAAFASSQPHYGQTWHLRFEGDRLTAFAAFPPNERIAFRAQDFGLVAPH